MRQMQGDTLREVQLKFETYFSKQKKETERVSIRHAVGRYLAEDISTDIDVPDFRRALLDGFAVRSMDTYAADENNTVFLKMAGIVQMGTPPMFTVGSGATAYIPAGGIVPDGANAVVPAEDVDLGENGKVGIRSVIHAESNLSSVGEEYGKGERFFDKGHRIRVKDVGILASCGKASILVYRKPVISILSTGDELVSPGEMPEPGQIRDINAYAIAAFAEATGAEIRSIEIVGDQYDIYRVSVTDALQKSDLVLISGGSSAGNKDMTDKVIASLGSPGVVTRGLAMNYAKTMIFGILKQPEKVKAIIGLPGNPTSAIIVYDVLVSRFLQKYYLGNSDDPQSLMAVMAENVAPEDNGETHVLVSIEKVGEDGEPESGKKKAKVLQGAPCVWIAKPIRSKFGTLSQLMQADGYVVMPPNAGGIEAGRLVEVVLIGNGY
jgi:molybdopterin molybdotransferase